MSRGKEVKAFLDSKEPNTHASIITILIQETILEAGVELRDMQAVNCCKGPGSFTALRVGQSVCKAICLTQNIPLLASDAFTLLINKHLAIKADFIFSLIKARKDEAYCALFDQKRNMIRGPSSLEIHNQEFNTLIHKYRPFIIADHLFDYQIPVQSQISSYSALDLVHLGLKGYKNKTFENIYTFSPLYIKPPNITKPRNRKE